MPYPYCPGGITVGYPVRMGNGKPIKYNKRKKSEKNSF